MKPFFAFIIVIVGFSACSKNVDRLEEPLSFQIASDVSGQPYANCKLRSIAHEHMLFGPKLAFGLFTYFSNGNPYSLTYKGQHGQGNYFFYYDKNLRLIELYCDGPTLPIKNRYGYNSQNQIIVDTLFNATSVSEDGVYTFAPRLRSEITYDFQGRIIKEVATEISDGSVFATRTYNYDNRGNLVVPGGGFTYDDKVSIFRAHPVFQFVNRNYSMNNPVQPAYNSVGLPLTFKPSNSKFFDAYYGVTKAIYDCD